MAGDSTHRLSFEAQELDQLVARARFLHERRLPEAEPLEHGGWLDILVATLGACSGVSQSFEELSPQEFSAGDPPVAFEHVLAPFLIVARCEFKRAAGSAATMLSDSARATLERSLLQILSRLSLSALEMEFGLFRALDGPMPWRSPDGENELYRRFVGRMLGGGLTVFLVEYAVLARLLAQWVGSWARLHGELLLRLREDWAALQEWLGLDRADCGIKTMAPYRSDPHNDGRAVTLLELESGRWLVYKPRGLAMEQAHGQLLEWANTQGFSRPFRTPQVMDRGDYGWMEYIATAECGNDAEVEQFYWRLGGHLALLYFLQGTDFHHENLIAHGSQPVWVDSETLLQPRMWAEHSRLLGPGSHRLHNNEGDFAVSETGVLPTCVEGRNSEQVDFSAFGASAEQETPFRVVSCNGLNTDSMTLSSEIYRVAVKGNVPLLKGRQARAGEHSEALLAGFSELFQLVVRHQAQWQESTGPLRHFRGCRGRYILRSTHAYGLLMQESLRPEWLRDGAARGMVFEILRNSAMRGGDRPPMWRFFEVEQRALERMDVPYFEAACEVGSPSSMGDESGLLWAAPLEEVRQRVAVADDGQLPFHLNAIRGALGLATRVPDGALETTTVLEGVRP